MKNSVKKITAFAFLLLTMGLSVSAQTLASYAGDWVNIDPASRSLAKISVAVSGANVTIHPWGSCTPLCDWGVLPATPYAPNVSTSITTTTKTMLAEYNTPAIKHVIEVELAGDVLIVETFVRFTDGSGRSSYTMTDKFRRDNVGGGGVTSVNCDAIAPYGTAGQYRILDGNMAMLLFPNKKDAERTVEVAKKYGLNSQCFVGRPNAQFKYWLTNGNAPTGTMAGEDCLDFNPNTIEVKQISGTWKIVDGSHWMFDFGTKEADARQSFCLIKKYGFTKTCFVGRPGPPMTYLKK
jgi:hypothetical protein